MIAILKMVFASKLGLIGIALAGSLLGGAYFYHTSRVATLELTSEKATVRADQAEERLGRAVALYENLRREKVAAEESAKRLQANLAGITARHSPIRQRINSAPTSDDGPLSPVLRDTLRALREKKP